MRSNAERRLVLPEGQPIISAISAARFKPVRVREGYDMGDVDQLLDDCEQAIRAREPLEPVVRREIRRHKMREGYAIAEVDAFLETLVTGDQGRAYEVARIHAPEPPERRPRSELTPEQARLVDDIDHARFRPRMLRAGYPMDAVDRMLDELARAVEDGEPMEVILDTRFEVTKNGDTYRPEDVDAFLERFRSLV